MMGVRFRAATVGLLSLAACFAVAPADAATLAARTDCVFLPGDFDCRVRWKVVYTAGAELNRVVTTGTTVYDPGVPMTGEGSLPEVTDPPSPDEMVDNLDVVPISESANCVSPGKSFGSCITTPGRHCEAFYGCFLNTPSFEIFEVDLGGGADSLKLLPAGLPAVVSMGPGNDKVDSRNGIRDVIACGDGADSVIADYKDQVAADCGAEVSRGSFIPHS